MDPVSQWPPVSPTETPSFWRQKSLSFEGHLEKKMKSIFGNHVYATVFFCSISTICFSAGDEAQRCRVNWTKTDPQHMGPYRYLLPQAYFPTKLHSTGLYVRIHKEGFEMEMEK